MEKFLNRFHCLPNITFLRTQLTHLSQFTYFSNLTYWLKLTHSPKLFSLIQLYSTFIFTYPWEIYTIVPYFWHVSFLCNSDYKLSIFTYLSMSCAFLSSPCWSLPSWATGQPVPCSQWVVRDWHKSMMLWGWPKTGRKITRIRENLMQLLKMFFFLVCPIWLPTIFSFFSWMDQCWVQEWSGHVFDTISI